MTTVGIRNLKNSLSQYLNLVKTGERVIITDHNRIVAELVPYSMSSTPSGLVMEYFEEQILAGSIEKSTKKTRISKQARSTKFEKSELEKIYAETRSER